MKNNYVSNKAAIPNTIAFTVYTDEMIDICYPDASKGEKDYISFSTDYEKLELIQDSLPFEIHEVRRVVLDEEFLEWLKINNLLNNDKNRSLYAQETSDKDAIRLWEKNGMNFEIWPVLLPVVVTNFKQNNVVPANEIEISDSLTSKVAENISILFGTSQNNLYVSSCMTRADIWDEEQTCIFYDFLEQKFNGEQISYEPPKKLVVQKQVNCDVRFIPIGIKVDRKAVLTYKDLEKEDNFVPHFEVEEAKNFSDYFSDEFALKNLSVEVINYCCMPDEALEVREDLVTSLKINANKEGIKLNQV